MSTLDQVEEVELLETIRVTGYTVSLVAASMIVMIILVTMALNRKLMDRVSIRFTLVISLVDMLIAIMNLMECFDPSQGIACVMTYHSIFFSSLFYVFIYSAIAFNLQLLFINEVPVKPRIELNYWSVVVIVPFILTLSNAFLTDFGYCYEINELDITEENLDTDFVMEMEIVPYQDRLKIFTLEWGFNNGWTLLLSVYCIMIFIMINFKLGQYNRKLSFLLGDSNSSSQSRRTNSAISKIICRVALYCIIPILFSSANYVQSIYYLINGTSTFHIFLFFRLSEGLPGTLNFLVFLCDPILPQAIHCIYESLITCLTFRLFSPRCTGIPTELTLSPSRTPYYPNSPSPPMGLDPPSYPDEPTTHPPQPPSLSSSSPTTSLQDLAPHPDYYQHPNPSLRSFMQRL